MIVRFKIMRDIINFSPFCRENGSMLLAFIKEINGDIRIKQCKFFIRVHRDMACVKNSGDFSGIGEGNFRIPALL